MKPDLAVLKTFLTREGRLDLDCAYDLVKRGGEVFKSEANILQLKYPVTGAYPALTLLSHTLSLYVSWVCVDDDLRGVPLLRSHVTAC